VDYEGVTSNYLTKSRNVKLCFISIPQYRLELENVKPSFDVKLKTGLHRGPYKSRRGDRRSQVAADDSESTYGRSTAGSRAASCAPAVTTVVDEHGYERPVHQRYHFARRPDFDENDDGLALYRAAATAANAAEEQWLPSVDHYRTRRYDNPFFRSTIHKYGSKSGKWLREMDQIDAEARQWRALTDHATFEPSTARRSRTSDEYNHLLTVLAREGVRGTSNGELVNAMRAGQPGFFDVDDRAPDAVDDGEEFLDQLMDRPFARGRGRMTSEDLENWRPSRVSRRAGIGAMATKVFV